MKKKQTRTLISKRSKNLLFNARSWLLCLSVSSLPVTKQIPKKGLSLNHNSSSKYQAQPTFYIRLAYFRHYLFDIFNRIQQNLVQQKFTCHNVLLIAGPDLSMRHSEIGSQQQIVINNKIYKNYKNKIHSNYLTGLTAKTNCTANILERAQLK